jgi:hypothetical protein
LERTTRADHAAYDSVPIEGYGTNTQRYVEDSEWSRSPQNSRNGGQTDRAHHLG